MPANSGITHSFGWTTTRFLTESLLFVRVILVIPLDYVNFYSHLSSVFYKRQPHFILKTIKMSRIFACSGKFLTFNLNSILLTIFTLLLTQFHFIFHSIKMSRIFACFDEFPTWEFIYQPRRTLDRDYQLWPPHPLSGAREGYIQVPAG